ncbi:RnfABCDGE type electron transport complex subunit G [Halomonas nitroreducens]|uniref:Ion-translocating oxidoreductase complex subunit G n=1 Tax=Halomonas nitroreducens TaxID=447425 RepID=A0A3S0KT63_9GAMM|nr:RnfABCDGE type electron transport complex subunit G [Halomonas nitroreducens]RTR06428.1 RnfABCDGE type electron transport complex subunit G [Halomonas nitroreducens]
MNAELPRAMGRAALGLATFALITAGSVALTRDLTAERIADNRQASRHREVAAVAPAGHDDRLLDHVLSRPAAPMFGFEAPITLWQARAGERVLGVVVPVTARQGYSGDIAMVVGLDTAGTITGVRVTDHRETPGLGDRIEARKGDWIEQFTGHSLTSPPAGGWAVGQDGGGIDALTGATITSRAVVAAVHRTLEWFETQPGSLLAPPATGETP